MLFLLKLLAFGAFAFMVVLGYDWAARDYLNVRAGQDQSKLVIRASELEGRMISIEDRLAKVGIGIAKARADISQTEVQVTKKGRK